MQRLTMEEHELVDSFSERARNGESIDFSQELAHLTQERRALVRLTFLRENMQRPERPQEVQTVLDAYEDAMSRGEQPDIDQMVEKLAPEHQAAIRTAIGVQRIMRSAMQHLQERARRRRKRGQVE